MPHDEHEHCGCGCDCGHDHDAHQADAHIAPIKVAENQMYFLHLLSHHHYLPVARFTITDSREDEFVSTALAPVYLGSPADDMETVKEAGEFLKELEDMGLITLDYDIFLNGYEYEEYKTSTLYEYFCKTVAEGATRPNFLGDTPVLDLGSIALTEVGAQIAAAYCNHEHEHHE